jgi:hypothetical protein
MRLQRSPTVTAELCWNWPDIPDSTDRPAPGASRITASRPRRGVEHGSGCGSGGLQQPRIEGVGSCGWHLVRGGSLFGGDGGASLVPGGTLGRVPRSLPPAEPWRQAIPALGYCRPFLPIRGRPQRDVHFEARSRGLRPRCLRFAGSLRCNPRKTRFWLAANLYQAGFAPAGFHREVSDLESGVYIAFLLHQAYLAHSAWRTAPGTCLEGVWI